MYLCARMHILRFCLSPFCRVLAEIAKNASQSAARTAKKQTEMIETIAEIANASNTFAARSV